MFEICGCIVIFLESVVFVVFERFYRIFQGVFSAAAAAVVSFRFVSWL